MGCFIYFSIFATLFPQHVFPIYLYKVTYKWHMGEITYHQMIQAMKQRLVLISIDM